MFHHGVDQNVGTFHLFHGFEDFGRREMERKDNKTKFCCCVDKKNMLKNFADELMQEKDLIFLVV